MATDTAPPDDERIRRDEQAAHDHARALLAAMRERTEAAIGAATGANDVDQEIAEWTLRHRLSTMFDDPAGLFFGSIDGPDGAFHVGRRHIDDADGHEVVVDWRAPAATPFYRATWADPLDLDRRRRHTIEDSEVIAVFEEDFDDPDGRGGGGVPDPLIAELERSRSGEMRDIVATIQGEQDEIIRAPLDETIVVQGGPGTGKTAVGLHRAAFLMYEHRERLSREGVLVVGPNQRFLGYISQVLPSLGEHAVTQLTIDGLADPRRFTRASESDAAAAVKGHIAMVDVIERLATHRISSTGIETGVGHRVVRLDEHDVREIVETTLGRGGAVNRAREGVRQAIARAALERRHARHPDERMRADELRRQLLTSKDFTSAFDRMWPSQSPAQLLRLLLSNATVRDAVMPGFAATERDAIARKVQARVDDEPWTSADLLLLAELEHRLNGGVGTTFGHIVVDEAQDLSAMGLRLIGRRSRRGSATILGDLAQATTPASQTSWDDTVSHLGIDEGRTAELTIGYRLPSGLLDAASTLLPHAAPGVRPSTSVRVSDVEPIVVTSDDLDAAVVEHATELAARYSTVAVITAPNLVEHLESLLAAADVDATAIHAVESKGLEFDAVVVAEPAAIAGGTARGLRALYVALTRAVQEVVIVHHEPLPGELSLRGPQD